METAERKLEILILRHCETEWNRLGILQGQNDIPLNSTGIDQASRIKIPKEFSGAPVLSSPYQRALQTASLATLKTPQVCKDLREMSYGDFEGKKLAEYQDFNLSFGREWLGMDHPLPNGETVRQVRQRVQSSILYALFHFSPPCGRVVFVTHKGWLMAFYSLLWGWTLEGPPPQKIRYNCGHSVSVSVPHSSSAHQDDPQLKLKLLMTNIPLHKSL